MNKNELFNTNKKQNINSIANNMNKNMLSNGIVII